MAENDTLLAHMIPWLTSQVEVAATRSLTFILNESADCRAALDELLTMDEFPLEPIIRFTSEEALSSTSRLDLVGYDGRDARSLLIEAKFWASLSDGQVSEYVTLLEGEGPGVLLFLCPQRRVESLWSDVKKQLRSAPFESSSVSTRNNLQCVEVHPLGKRIAVVSWRSLLDEIESRTNDEAIRSDIQQLRGLTQRMNDEGFGPLSAKATAEDFKERDDHLRRMVYAAVSRGVSDKWLDVEGLQAAPRSDGYGRYARVVGTRRILRLGIEYTEELFGRTPIWVSTHISDWSSDQPSDLFEGPIGGRWWTPIKLKDHAVYETVLDDVVSQFESIARAFKDAHGV